MLRENEGKKGRGSIRSKRQRWRTALFAAGAAVLAGCDFSIVNPGPVADVALDDPASHPAIVRGMELALLTATNSLSYTGAVIARELVASGSTQAFGVIISWRNGRLLPNEVGGHWTGAHRARWVAEAGVARFREVLGAGFSSSPLAARALIQVGYSNRLLGENFCHAVIDGGPAQSHIVHFERAEAAFTEALDIASGIGDAELALIARAGRASVRVSLGTWAGAVADAGQVPLEFRHSIQFSSTAGNNQFNEIYWASANQPYRNHTVWSTFFEGYYLEEGDPRTSWGTSAEYPAGENAAIPWYFQTKFNGQTAPLNLSTGREARLIVAEGQIHAGNLSGAVQSINEVRTPLGLAPVNPSTLSEAWAALKLERTAELWLEARRLGDYRRWEADGTPGSWPQLLNLDGRDTCFPIAQNELNTNPNLF